MEKIKIPYWKLIKNIVRHEQMLKRAIWERRHDHAPSKVSVPAHAFISNPTENQALQNISSLRKVTCDDGFTLKEPEKWLEVLVKAYDIFPPKAIEVIRSWADGWTATRITCEYPIGRTTFYDLQHKFLFIVLMVASKYGLVDVTQNKNLLRDIEEEMGEDIEADELREADGENEFRQGSVSPVE